MPLFTQPHRRVILGSPLAGFWIGNAIDRSDFPDSLEIWLEVGPRDSATRNRLLDAARKNSMSVEMVDGTEDNWFLYKRSMLTSKSFDSLSDEERDAEVRKQWASFLEDDMPRIEEALRKVKWIWK